MYATNQSNSRRVAQGVGNAASNPDDDGTSGESWVQDAGYQGTNAIRRRQTQLPATSDRHTS